MQLHLLMGSTHLRFVSGGASIDFEGGMFEAITTWSADFAITEAPLAAVELLNQLTANITHPLFLALGIEFYQQVNGVNYALKMVALMSSPWCVCLDYNIDPSWKC